MYWCMFFLVVHWNKNQLRTQYSLWILVPYNCLHIFYHMPYMCYPNIPQLYNHQIDDKCHHPLKSSLQDKTCSLSQVHCMSYMNYHILCILHFRDKFRQDICRFRNIHHLSWHNLHYILYKCYQVLHMTHIPWHNPCKLYHSSLCRDSPYID